MSPCPSVSINNFEQVNAGWDRVPNALLNKINKNLFTVAIKTLQYFPGPSLYWHWLGIYQIGKGQYLTHLALPDTGRNLERTKNIQKTSRKSFGGLMYIQFTSSVQGEFLATITILLKYKSTIFIFIFSYFVLSYIQLRLSRDDTIALWHIYEKVEGFTK